MAFTSISTTDIEAGDPVTQELFDLVRTNENDLDSRVTTLEGSTLSAMPITLHGYNLHYVSNNTVLGTFKVPFDMNFTDNVLLKIATGISGTLDFDVLKASTLGGSYSSIFSTTPSISSTSANQSVSGTLNVTSATAGEFLQFKILTQQLGCVEFHFQLYIEVA